MLRILQALFISVFLFFFSYTNVVAAPLCSPSVSVETTNNFNTVVSFDTSSASGLSNGTQLRLSTDKVSATSTVQNNTAVFSLGELTPGAYSFVLYRIFEGGRQVAVCSRGTSFTVPDAKQGGTVTNVSGSIEFSPVKPKSTDIITVTVRDLPKEGRYFVSASQQGVSTNFIHKCAFSSNKILSVPIGPLKEGTWIVYVAENKDQTESNICQSSGNGIASGNITISIPEKYDSKIFSTPTPTPPPLPLNCVEGTYKDTSGKKIVTTDKKLMQECTKIDTALGTFGIEPAEFIRSIFGILLSLSGGIALLLIIISGYRLMTSQGNPEKVQAAREQLTSAVVGLLFIIFSIAILTIIGVDILRLPGFRP